MKLVSGRIAALAIVFGLGIAATPHSNAQAPAQGQTSSTALAFKPDMSGPPPLAPARGTIRAYTISSPDEMVPGQLADGYLGDYVLQNDTMRVIIARPEKKGLGGIAGGSILDVSRETRPLDYINSIKTVPDIATTDSAVQFTYTDPPAVDDSTTASLVMYGTANVGSTQDDTAVPVEVVTTYTLAKNSNVMEIRTGFKNPGTTQTAALLPGDVADWGEALSFVEGTGVPNNLLTTATYTLGFASDYSVGLITSGTSMLTGFHTRRDSVLPAYEPPAASTDTLQRRRDLPTRTPNQQDAAAASGGGPTLSPIQLLQERIRRGEVQVSSETQYGTATTASLNALAGLTSGALEQSKTTVDDAPDTASRKLALAPGQSFEFTRYLVISDADFSRIVDFAYNEKKIPTSNLVGVVLEAGTDKPLANADVYISGGPAWNGTVTPAAYYRARTRADGTFACKVPPGKYVVMPGMPGRRSISEYTVQHVKPGDRNKILALVLTPESIVRVAVSEAETRTSSPLPCKITFVPKEGTPRMDWGDGPRGDHGVRNAWFLPYGWANIPLTPGRYVAYISRGPEYDVVREDISLAPGGQQVLKISLPHLLKQKLPGMFSVDAGLLTTASASAAAPLEDRILQAVCEGVHVIVSGDYNQVTDFQPVIDRLGLGRWIKGMRGMRLLLNKGEESAEVLAYPLSPAEAAKLTALLPDLKDVPPDLALADLRKAFPNVLLEIAKPTDPERGYFQRYDFNPLIHQFSDKNLPPPDYDSIQIFEGKKIGQEQVNYPRYSDLQVIRTNDPIAKVAPLSPVAYSGSSLPFAQEIGYPRLYLHTNKTKLEEITEEDLVQRIRTQHYMVTNGPIVNMEVQSMPSGRFDKRPGDVVDLSTTRILRLQMRVLAPQWVSFSGWAVHENGLVQVSTPGVRPVPDIQRYPVLGTDITTRYIDKDTILDGVAYGANRSLAPIVSDALPDFGGPVHPYSFTGPVFVDKDSDGKIRLNAPQLTNDQPQEAPPPTKDPTITE